MIEIQHRGDGILAVTPQARPGGRVLIWVGIILSVILLWQVAIVGLTFSKKKHPPIPAARLIVIFICAAAPAFILWGRALLASDEIILDTKKNLVLVKPLEGEHTSYPLGLVREVTLQRGLQRDPLKAEEVENWAILLIADGEPVILGAFVVEAVDVSAKTNLLEASAEIARFIGKPVRSDFSPD
jgi:hypothetical protein